MMSHHHLMPQHHDEELEEQEAQAPELSLAQVYARAIRAELAEGIGVTDEQIEAALPRFADELTSPARIRARQIFVQDPERARSWYREAARRGVAVAQLQLGLLLQQEGNPDEAFGWIEAAARQGLPTALLQLGLAHERGRGGPVDLSLAAQSYRRAATELDEARLLLSRLLIKEFGQPADLAEAAALLAGLDSEAAQTLRALLLPGDQTSP